MFQLTAKNVYCELKTIKMQVKYYLTILILYFLKKSFGILITLYPKATSNLVRKCRTKSSTEFKRDSLELFKLSHEILKEIKDLLLHPSNECLCYLYLFSNYITDFK